MKGILCLCAFLLVSCGSREILTVRQFHLRKAKVPTGNEYVRAEANMRLYGAISAKEREARRGQHYTIRWRDLSGESPVKVVMEYRQASTGSRVKRLQQTFPASRTGKTEFKITGPAYLKKGRVIAWRISLYEGEEKVAMKRSYLWE